MEDRFVSCDTIMSGEVSTLVDRTRLATHAVPTRFRQDCKTCGRVLLVRVEVLGLQVACSHCGSCFLATDAAPAPHSWKIE
jgi:hypothetical protein